jgi:nucleotide sugar dehydrogenase
MSVIVKSEIIKVRDIRTAEAIKLFESIYRDVNIALANELAILSEILNVDFDECRKAAITQPYCHLHLPGAGTGGACLPVNPYLLLNEVRKKRTSSPIIQAARRRNEEMITHVLRSIEDGLQKCKKRLKKARIAVLGISYKPNVKDHFLSPAIQIISELKKRGAHVIAYDPYFSVKELKKLGYKSVKALKSMRQIDCILIAMGHDKFRKMEISTLKKIARMPTIIVDFGRVLDPEEIKKAGFYYKGIGYGE